jgi:hypothetical protein
MPPLVSSPSAPDRFDAKDLHDLRDARDYDDDYAAFVARMWKAKGVEVPRLWVMCDGKSCQIFSIVAGPHGYPYVNLFDGAERATYAGDGRREWARDGEVFDESAFCAVLAGVPPDLALRPEAAPQTMEQAAAKNRAKQSGRAFFLNYRNSKGEASWRIISGVRRAEDHFSAQCHFRWGRRRTFLFERVLEIADYESGELIQIKDFMRPASRKRERR